MPVTDITPSRSYQMPFPGDGTTPSNALDYDAARLRAALGAIDADVAALLIAVALRAPLASPPLTGTPTAPTAPLGTNTTQLANTAFVQAAVAALVASAPGTLDTLNELAAALGSDPNFATTVATALALKAPLASPPLTGTPTAPTATAGTNTTQLATTAYVVAGIATAIADRVQNTRQIATQHSLTGGGQLTADRTLSLVNDTAVPGNNRLYGTNEAGVRGWFDAAHQPILTSESVTGVAGRTYRLIGPSAVTVTLPATPSAGDMLRLIDGEAPFGIQHIAARNGRTIMGWGEDLTLDWPAFDIQIWWSGTDWRVF